MLWLMLCLLPVATCSQTAVQDVTYKDDSGGGGGGGGGGLGGSSDDDHMEVAVTTRPHIYYCRSPNMEDFTCWWHPLDNLTEGEDVTYVFTYSKDKGPTHECPDYVTAGANSCHFDSSHTSIWKIYCMNVTAVTAHRNYTSLEHCLDVAEIVQTEAPVNLTYTLSDAGGDEMGHNAQLAWTYPVPSDLQYGWITLVYELQYRRKLLVLILVTGVGVVALLVIAFGVIPQSKRIKEYFLPPIPKPRIIGVDPLLLKKGNLDEINRHFSNFHSYQPPSYTEEVWDQVSADHMYRAAPRDCGVPAEATDREKDALMVPCDLPPVAAHLQLTTPSPTSYMQSPSPYCSSPPEAFTMPLDAASLWPAPEIMSLPGTDYSIMGNIMGHPNSAPAPDGPAFTTSRSPQDFYTCVQLMNESGEVHLVPCLPPPYCREFPPPPRVDLNAAEKEEKKKKLADYQARKNVMKEATGGDEAERSEATVPLLPVAVDNKG
ncbi:hypothetical protein INR49_022016 [Caranx melampygus]|nr:hypothetical protein INR49_022016 [Caranx melampygus]